MVNAFLVLFPWGDPQPTKAKRKRPAASGEALAVKRRREAALLKAQKAAASRGAQTLRGKASRAALKKPLASAGGKSQEQRPGVKTSSLFKNNPDIPELPR